MAARRMSQRCCENARTERNGRLTPGLAAMARPRKSCRCRSGRRWTKAVLQQMKTPATCGRFKPAEVKWRGLAELSGLPGNLRDVKARDADVGKFAVAEAVKLAQAVIVALPFTDEADEVGKHS